MSLNVQLVGTLKQVKVFKVVHVDGRTPFIKFRNLKRYVVHTLMHLEKTYYL